MLDSRVAVVPGCVCSLARARECLYRISMRSLHLSFARPLSSQGTCIDTTDFTLTPFIYTNHCH